VVIGVLCVGAVRLPLSGSWAEEPEVQERDVDLFGATHVPIEKRSERNAGEQDRKLLPRAVSE